MPDVEKILEESNGGWDFFKKHIPNLVKENKGFKDREGEKTASAYVTKKGDRYIFKDFGGGRFDKAVDVFEFAKDHYNLPSLKDFPEVLKRMAEELGISLEKKEKPKSYIRPNYRTPLQKSYDKMIDYWQKRQISKETIEEFGIYLTRGWNPATKHEAQAMVFPYTKDGELVNNKIRYKYEQDGVEKKTFTQEAQAESVLFGLDKAAGKKTWVIVEGEPDTLSCYQVLKDIEQIEVNSYKAIFRKDLPEWMYDVGAVAVPCGSNDNLQCITNCIEWLDQVETFIIFSDNDKAGETLRSNLCDRLPSAKVKVVNTYHGCKDANEIHSTKGAAYLLNSIALAEHLPIEDIFAPAADDDLWDEMIGFVEGTVSFTDRLGWALDIIYRPSKSLCCITGVPTAGKSALATNIAVKFTFPSEVKVEDKTFVRDGGKVLIYSPEEQDIIKLSRTVATASGIPYLKEHPNYSKYYKREDFSKYRDWAREMIHWYVPKDNADVEELCTKIEESVYRLGIKMVIIDPFSHVEASEKSRHEDVRVVLRALNVLKRRCNIDIILVAHPKKIQYKTEDGDKVLLPVEPYDIAESSHFFNACDFILSMYRNKKINVVDIICKKLKMQGIEGMREETITAQFDVSTNRFYGIGEANKEYLHPITEATWTMLMSEPKPAQVQHQLDAWSTRRFDSLQEGEMTYNGLPNRNLSDEELPF